MYNYQAQRKNLFTEQGSILFLKVRDKVNKLLEISGAVMTQYVSIDVGCDSWDFLACFDRMVELEEIKEMTSEDTYGQYRVFIKKRKNGE